MGSFSKQWAVYILMLLHIPGEPTPYHFILPCSYTGYKNAPLSRGFFLEKATHNAGKMTALLYTISGHCRDQSFY